jgi:hypothetical protein
MLFITTPHTNFQQVTILYTGIFKTYHLSKLQKWYPDMVLQAEFLSMNSSICTQIYLTQYTLASRVLCLQTNNPLTKKAMTLSSISSFIIISHISFNATWCGQVKQYCDRLLNVMIDHALSIKWPWWIATRYKLVQSSWTLVSECSPWLTYISSTGQYAFRH